MGRPADVERRGPLNARAAAMRCTSLAPAPMSARAQSDAELLEFIAHKQPLSGGMLDANDVAETALFLLGDQSRHVTGQVVSIDGGWTVSG